MENLEKTAGQLINYYIDLLKKDKLDSSILRKGYLDKQYVLDDGGEFILCVEYDYDTIEVEPEQVGDWFTPSYPAVYEYRAITESAYLIDESGDTHPIAITKNLRYLTALVVDHINK